MVWVQVEVANVMGEETHQSIGDAHIGVSGVPRGTVGITQKTQMPCSDQ